MSDQPKPKLYNPRHPERLLRYCARPPFATECLRKEGAALVYRCAKQHSEPGSDKRGAKADELHLTPLELIDRIAALVPPPRTHRHRYLGVLASNSPLIPPKPEPATPKWSKAHYLWAVLIAFITEGTQIRKILDHIGVDSEPPHIAPARGPPLWGDCDAQTDDGAQIEPADWGLAAQPAPDYEVDQRVSW
jgi:hypothetical protein